MARIHPELATIQARAKKHHSYVSYISLLLSIIALLKAFNVIKW